MTDLQMKNVRSRIHKNIAEIVEVITTTLPREFDIDDAPGHKIWY